MAKKIKSIYIKQFEELAEYFPFNIAETGATPIFMSKNALAAMNKSYLASHEAKRLTQEFAEFAEKKT